jgi:hypothetical protein
MSASFHIWRFSRSKPPDITPIAIEQRFLSGRLLPDRITCNSIGAPGHRDGVATFCASSALHRQKGSLLGLSPKVGDGENRKGGISWRCLTPPLRHRRSDTPCPKITVWPIEAGGHANERFLYECPVADSRATITQFRHPFIEALIISTQRLCASA